MAFSRLLYGNATLVSNNDERICARQACQALLTQIMMLQSKVLTRTHHGIKHVPIHQPLRILIEAHATSQVVGGGILHKMSWPLGSHQHNCGCDTYTRSSTTCDVCVLESYYPSGI